MKRILMIIMLGSLGNLLSGCLPSDRVPGVVPVSGKIYYNDLPLEGATISFRTNTPDGRAGNAISALDGSFSLQTKHPNDGVLPGEYDVEITKEKLIYAPTDAEIEAHLKKTGTELETKWEYLIPRKYADRKTSGIKIAIPQEGNKNLKIELFD